MYYGRMNMIAPAPGQWNPRSTAVDFIDIQFSEAVVPASFGLEDVSLSRNGIPVELAAAAGIQPVADDTFRV